MKRALSRKRKGFGGIFFIVCCSIAALIMITVISFSRVSTMRAVADNTAFIVATKVATYSYNEGLSSYTLTGNRTITGTTYSPLQDFNNMMSGYDMIESGSTQIRVEWDNSNRIVTVDIGPFRTVYGDNITPYRQAASIEDR